MWKAAVPSESNKINCKSGWVPFEEEGEECFPFRLEGNILLWWCCRHHYPPLAVDCSFKDLFQLSSTMRRRVLQIMEARDGMKSFFCLLFRDHDYKLVLSRFLFRVDNNSKSLLSEGGGRQMKLMKLHFPSRGFLLKMLILWTGKCPQPLLF